MWFVLALGSAVFAALTSILAKVGIDDSHYSGEKFLIGALQFHVVEVGLDILLASILILHHASRTYKIGDIAAQDVHIKWFGEIEISTSLKSFEHILVACLGSKEYDRDMIGVDILLDFRA